MQSGSEKKLMFYCALAGILLSMAGFARGDFVRVDLYGEVTSVIDSAGLLGGQVGVGNEITGWYKFDTSTPDSKPLSSNEGDYQQTSPSCGISLNINGILFASDTQNMNYLIKLINDTSSKDSYLVSSTSNLPLISGLEVSSIRWQLDDSTSSALSSDALVAVTPWQWGSSILDITCRGTGGVARIEAIIPYTEIIPEPSTVLLLMAGLPIFCRKEKRRTSNIQS